LLRGYHQLKRTLLERRVLNDLCTNAHTRAQLVALALGDGLIGE